MVVVIKAVKSAIFPPAINILLVLLGMLLIKRFPKTGKSCIAIALVSLYLFSITPVSKLLLSGLEDIPALPLQISNSGEQAIVVLGGGLHSDAPEYFSDTVGSYTLERLRYAALLHRKTALPVLVTGGRLHNEKLSEADAMQRTLVDSFNITTQWKESNALNTAENAINSAAMLEREKIEHIYLVTHAWHMKRALAVFEKQGLRVTPAPTAYASLPSQRSLVSQLIPDSSVLLDSNLALNEYLGMLWYVLRYH